MDAQALYALRDVAGVPTHPVVFLILGVVTFALHIAAVQIMLGASGLTIWGALSKDSHQRRLAQSMVMVSKVMLSIAIVIGVAPLLFVQVTYDPFWYTSNVLSAWWVIGFLLFLTVGALLWFFFNAKNENLATEKTFCPGSAIFAVVMFLIVGFIMHVLTNQMLSPEKWMQWYAPNGVIDTSGRGIHDFNLARFLFFISLSVPVIGAVLVGYRRYYLPRLADKTLNMTQNYLDWAGRLGQNLIVVGGVVSVLIGAWWMATLPANQAAFALSPWVLLSLALLLAFVAFAFWVRMGKMDTLWAYAVLPVGAVALIMVAAAREILRYHVLMGAHGYDVFTYPINMDWYSTIMFFGTFLIVGGGVLAYMLTVAWKAGQAEGVYTPGPIISRMGDIGIALIVLWIVQYFAVGLYVWLS
ncbi:MAG: hypothetical protein B7Y40_10655 [Gammaproteobacteria bacterium 28-57-27]|nr:MAG: hypothetical protein B7Y40_10655 [Gammaproteobacteria bacterium 28-57-27]